jgi:hypothetical protein
VDAYSADVSRVYEPLWNKPESEDVRHEAQKEPALVEL